MPNEPWCVPWARLSRATTLGGRHLLGLRDAEMGIAGEGLPPVTAGLPAVAGGLPHGRQAAVSPGLFRASPRRHQPALPAGPADATRMPRELNAPQ
jgi:hypothetical protein